MPIKPIKSMVLYSGFAITVSRGRIIQVAFSSRKSHRAQQPETATAVPQLLYPEAATAKWLFPQEKATVHSSQKRLQALWNRSKPIAKPL
ncbi:MAG: hypothetical protein WB341_13440 [Terracidiphilus sp.]